MGSICINQYITSYTQNSHFVKRAFFFFKPKQSIQRHVESFLKNVSGYQAGSYQEGFKSSISQHIRMELRMSQSKNYNRSSSQPVKRNSSKTPIFPALNFRNFYNQQTCLYLKYHLHAYFRDLCNILMVMNLR